MAKTELLARLDAAIAEKKPFEASVLSGLAGGEAEPGGAAALCGAILPACGGVSEAPAGAGGPDGGPAARIDPGKSGGGRGSGGAASQALARFCGGGGSGEDDITCCPALPGTQAVVQTFREICGDRPVAEAVAALYAYESQVPEIATTKIDGLKKFYGVTQPEGLAYFVVHEEADKAHRAAWRGWLEDHADGNEEEILATTNEALDALWGALDAVHCEKQEVTN